jgi:hypothetical protein
VARRLPLLASVAALLAGCGRDASLTRGADGAPEWGRRLALAVPVGMSADSAWALLARNGFRCRSLAPSTGIGAYLGCDKYSPGRLAIVRRRWQASLALDGRRRVAAVRASTGLIGP